MQLISLDQTFAVIKTILTISLGAIIVAMGFSMFQVPFNLAAGGLTGITIIIRKFIDFPTGILYLILNVPMMIIGYWYLGRWQFLMRTILSVLVFSVLYVGFLMLRYGLSILRELNEEEAAHGIS